MLSSTYYYYSSSSSYLTSSSFSLLVFHRRPSSSPSLAQNPARRSEAAHYSKRVSFLPCPIALSLYALTVFFHSMRATVAPSLYVKRRFCCKKERMPSSHGDGGQWAVGMGVEEGAPGPGAGRLAIFELHSILCLSLCLSHSLSPSLYPYLHLSLNLENKQCCPHFHVRHI